MKIREIRRVHPTRQGEGAAPSTTQARVREIGDGAPLPANAAIVDDATELHDWAEVAEEDGA